MNTNITKRILLLFVFTGLLIACACTKESDFDNYRKSVEDFYTTVTQSDDRIDRIDASSEKAKKELLEELDTLNDSFNQFAQIEVPSEFATAKTLAQDASEYMTEANKLYHTALESDSYDAFSLSLANEKYNQAIIRVNEIGSVLQGNEIDESLLN